MAELPNDYFVLYNYSIRLLEDVDFLESSRLRLAYRELVGGFVEQLCEKAVNIPNHEVDNA